MSETIQTINEDDMSSLVEDSSPLHSEDTTPIISDEEPSEQTLTADEEVEGESEEESVDDRGDADRLDKNPRFQQLNQRMKDAEQNAQQEREERIRLEGKLDNQAPPKQQKQEWEDISVMSQEDLRDWADTDLGGLLANVAKQTASEVKASVGQDLNQRERKYQERDTFDKYASKNPEFVSMYESGQLTQFCRTNPGHNLYSAYQELTMDKTIEQKIQEAVKEKVTKDKKNQSAKRKLRVIGEGPPAKKVTKVEDPFKADSKKSGGVTSLLLDRLRSRRASSDT